MDFFDEEVFNGSRLEDHLSWTDTEVEARITEARSLGQKSCLITCGWCWEHEVLTQKNFRTSAKNPGAWLITHKCAGEHNYSQPS